MAKTGESLHREWSRFLRSHGREVMPWAELPELTKAAWNSLVRHKIPGESLHRGWAKFLRSHGREVMPWAELPLVTKAAWNSLINDTPEELPINGKVTEEAILPRLFLEEQRANAYWRNQYMVFDKEVRDAAAQRLYDVLTEEQRLTLKNYAYIRVQCAGGHTVQIIPTYADTTNVGCYSLATKQDRYHAPTTVGDFLLTLKIRFALKCMCLNEGHKIIND